MITLRAVQASFIGKYTHGGFVFHGDLAYPAQGLIFQCPELGHMDAITIWFALSFGGVPKDALPLKRYVMTGTSLDDLTVVPEIWNDCGWHGHIEKGKIL